MWVSLHHTAVVTQNVSESLRKACEVPAAARLRPMPNRDRSERIRGPCAHDNGPTLLRQAFIARYVIGAHSWHSGVPLKKCKSCDPMVWDHALRYFAKGRSRPRGLMLTPFPWPNYRLALARRWIGDARQPTGHSGRRSDAVRSDWPTRGQFLAGHSSTLDVKRRMSSTRTSSASSFNICALRPPSSACWFTSLARAGLRVE